MDKVHKQRQIFWVLLQDRLGEQKIDIVMKDQKCGLLIYKVGRIEGVQLI
ncbi:MAG: hypothetical protein HEEMFOPI_01355 [Holosporales bacterium]